MDAVDRRIVSELMASGRMTFSDLAGALGLSGPAVAERVRKLEERGVIKGYAALVDAERVGCGVAAFIAVTLDRPSHRRAFDRFVEESEEVQECHHVAGDGDYLLKVRCAAIRDLEEFVSRRLKALPGIARTRTTIVLSSLKETPAVPVPTEPPDPARV
jgi:Lrp/AsnC family leucine-responsive transcriptional regulator